MSYPPIKEQAKAPTAVGSVIDFLRINQDITDFVNFDDLVNNDLLRIRLKQTPVQYRNVADGVTLLRGLLPTPAGSTDAHYVLLMDSRRWVLDIACINQGASSPSGLPELNTRHLLEYIIDADASIILLATSKDDYNNVFSMAERVFAEDLFNALVLFNIELLDWLIMGQYENTSLEDQRELLHPTGSPYLQQGYNILTEAGIDLTHID